MLEHIVNAPAVIVAIRSPLAFEIRLLQLVG
jgi:hypothetical protein